MRNANCNFLFRILQVPKKKWAQFGSSGELAQLNRKFTAKIFCIKKFKFLHLKNQRKKGIFSIRKTVTRTSFELEVIKIVSVAEDMDEKKTSFGFEPFWDFFEKPIVVFHVLEHFVCHDSVEFNLLKKGWNCRLEIVNYSDSVNRVSQRKILERRRFGVFDFEKRRASPFILKNVNLNLKSRKRFSKIQISQNWICCIFEF